MPMQKPKAAYKALFLPLLLSSQQPCEVGKMESEEQVQGFPERFMAGEGFESGSSNNQGNSRYNILAPKKNW